MSRLQLTITSAAFSLFLTSTVLYSSDWNVDADGVWSQPTNWSAGVPDGVGAVATFGNVITAPRTVTVDIAPTIGTLNFDNANAYSILGGVFSYSAPGTINISNVNGNGNHIVSTTIISSPSLVVTHNSTGTFTMSGTMIGSGGFQKLGTGTTVWSGPAATFSGNLIIDQGTLALAGTTVTLISGGQLLINSPGTLRLDSSNPLSPITDVTILGGSATFNVNGQSQTIASLTGAANPNINLNGGSLTIGFGGPSSSYDGTISGGAGTLTKTGGGTITFAGTTANTYTGQTTVNDGVLVASKTAGVISIPSASVLIDSTGMLQLAASGQMNTAAAVTVNTSGSTFDLNNITQTIGSLAGAGSVTLGSGTLTTGSAGSTLFSGGITGTGGLTKAGATTFTMTGVNNYSGGTLVSGGVLQGDTDSLKGTITNNASVVFDQAVDDTYSGLMTGTGSLTKQNAGNLTLSASSTIDGTTSVTDGRLSVNSLLFTTKGGMTVQNGATLGGTGTIAVNAPNSVTVNGTVAPGNSIGNLTINGDFNQGNNSTLEIEFTSDPLVHDELFVNGTYSIGSNATLSLIPAPGVYPSNFMITIVNANALSGTFATITTTLPTFQVQVLYQAGPGDIVLSNVITLPFSSVVRGGNAGAVATCIDTLSGGDADLVIAELRQIPTVEELTEALDLLQPSQFTALALAEENVTLNTNGTLFYRLLQEMRICPNACHQEEGNCAPKSNYTFWVSPFGALSYQQKRSNQPGFNAHTGGITTGFDFRPWQKWVMGGALGYTHIDLNWKESRGNSKMNNGYGVLYTGLTEKHAYVLGSAMFSYNHYDTSRHIVFGNDAIMDINRHAKSSHNGYQASGHLQGGLFWGKKLQFSPFGQLDYVFVHEGSFKEHGASSLDLHVKSKNSDLLEGELGFQLSRCFSVRKNSISPTLALSVIREWRFSGKHYRSSFTDSSCVMHTSGMNPNRTLFSPEAGFTILIPDENCTLSFDYKGKFGSRFQDHRLLAEFVYRF